MLPGAPRMPISWRAGRAKSPIAEMFTLPNRSIWLGPIITCRLPAARMSNTARKGTQPSAGPSGGSPTAQQPATNVASPSDSSRSGANVARASRAPMAGMVPNGLATISPSPRHASAHATAHTSALRRRRAHGSGRASPAPARAATARW